VTPGQFLSQYAEKSERLVVGLMSGTSVDGIDAALVRLSGSGRETEAELLRFEAVSWPDSLRDRILAVSHGTGTPEELNRLNFEVAEQFAVAARAVSDGKPLDAVGSHGQTVSHVGGVATLQLGSPAVLARRLGCVVVSDFRSADIALGGQGAPLVPFADWCLLVHDARSRAIQNIGGIGNVTFLPPSATPEQVRGFDTGPGNMLLDLAAQWVTGGAQSFDDDGKLAASGKIDFDLLERLIAHPFLKQVPPKSAGREEFGQAFFQTLTGKSVAKLDLLTTLTEFTALSIADAYQRFLPSMPGEVIVGGGGARNTYLMERLRARLPGIPVTTHDAVGINGDAKEALAFALLANETLLGNPSSLPSVTGATRPAVLGSMTFP
jgi:anhydro-N-acetylmuramic acid kinase